jgi:cell division protein FtsW
MARKLRPDAWLFTVTLVLLAVGAAWVYSASWYKNQEGLLLRQGMWIALGLVGMLAASQVDYKRYAHPAFLALLLGLTLVGLLAVFAFDPSGGGRRWLWFGAVGLQPSEFAKLAVIMFAAATIGAKLEENEPPEPAFARVGLVAGVAAALILLEPDGGGTAVLLGIVATIVFTAGLSSRWIGIAAAAAPVLAAVVLKLQPYRMDRIWAWLNPEADPMGRGYHPLQSLMAVASGGWWGEGYMNGVRRMGYLPAAHNDYIFAVIAEERGLIGATFVLLCFAVILWRGLRVARGACDAFGALLATGITAMIGLQAFYNTSVVVNLVPAKGLPLPFVSAGGSSMLVSLLAMGILLNISQQASATGS